MKDQKDKQCRFIFYSQFWSYLPGVPLAFYLSLIIICEMSLLRGLYANIESKQDKNVRMDWQLIDRC